MSEAAASASTMQSAASALRSSSSAYQCAASANQCAIDAAKCAQRAAQAAEIAEAAAHIAQSHAQSHAHNQQEKSAGLRCRVQVRIGNKRIVYSQHHESEAQAAEHAYIQFDGYAKEGEAIRITAHAAPHTGEAL